jgi:outer membrane protein OmpA-like peptidoglycan-associated protein
MNTSLTLRRIRQARIAAAVAAALLVGAPVAPTFADSAGATPSPRASKAEATGVASGFAVGAAAGGPIGALVGAAAGGWLGDRMHRERQTLEHTRDELAQAKLRGAGLTMHVMFRTDEAGLPASEDAPLAQFAALAAGTPGALVYVTGFADPRGTPRYNAALAAERATTVAARLVAAGLPAERLVVSSETAAVPAAAMESSAASPDLDGYAFQRRATLKIVLPAKGETRQALRR